MTKSHDRTGPASATGARDGAGGLEAAARAAASQPTAEGAAPAEPLPMQPGEEYVAKADFMAVADERDAMKADLQRVAADFENFKRRSAREREQASAAAETRLLNELLTVIDDTERAIDHAAKDDVDKAAVVDGLQTVHARLTGVVGTHGLERIPAGAGTAFDPNLHEAMMVQAPQNGEADDTILQELQSGWRVGERVLRHARVIVAGGG